MSLAASRRNQIVEPHHGRVCRHDAALANVVGHDRLRRRKDRVALRRRSRCARAGQQRIGVSPVDRVGGDAGAAPGRPGLDHLEQGSGG